MDTLRSKYSLALVAFLTFGPAPSRVQSQELDVTRSQSCNELGIKYSKCALATAAKMPCPTNWDFVRPDRCKGDAAFDKGIQQGTNEFYAALKQRDVRPVSRVAKNVPEVTEQRVEQRRRLTPAECRLMEMELPTAAQRLSNDEVGIKQLGSEVEGTTRMPEATRALIVYLAKYDSHSLRAFSYEMASDWAKKCRGGAIRTHSQ